MKTDFLRYFTHCVLKVLSCPEQLFLLQLPLSVTITHVPSHTRASVTILSWGHAQHCLYLHDESHFSSVFTVTSSRDVTHVWCAVFGIPPPTVIPSTGTGLAGTEKSWQASQAPSIHTLTFRSRPGPGPGCRGTA